MNYDTGNVVVCTVHQPHNFVLFEFTGFGTEKEHLKPATENDQSGLEAQVAELIKAEPGLSAYAIAKRLCPEGGNYKSFGVKVSRILKRISNTYQH
jgi:hypothetical protein